MEISKKMAGELLEVLEEIKEEFFQEENKEHPFSEWEKKREKIKKKMSNLSEYVEKAASQTVITQSTGESNPLELTKKTILFLFMKVMDKTSIFPGMTSMLVGHLLGLEADQKYMEGLHSDEDIILVLRTLFFLLVQDKKVPAGKGTR
jgi:hypothetical protein